MRSQWCVGLCQSPPTCLARRAAPIQVTCIGDPRTTGNPAIDVRLVDEITDPAPASDAYCTERLVRLPGCFLCYEPHEDAPPPRRPLDVDGAFVTFGSFNVADKTGPAVLDLWARLLRETPGSRLILKSLSYRPPEARERILARFRAAGVDPGRVSIVAEEQSMADHLAWYRQVDIALDTFPYAGTTTTCDALWMGVPVVTLRGAWHPARVGASLLAAVGLPELVADDPDHYVRIAHALADDRERLAALHAGLRPRLAASPLLDAATAFEAACHKTVTDFTKATAGLSWTERIDHSIPIGLEFCHGHHRRTGTDQRSARRDRTRQPAHLHHRQRLTSRQP